MPNQQNNASNRSLIAKLMFVSALLFSLIFFPFEIGGFSNDWSEDFEGYDVGLLSNNPKWTGDASFLTTDDSAYIYNGTKAGKLIYYGGFQDIVFDPDDDISSGEKQYFFWQKPVYWTDSWGGYLQFHFTPITGVPVVIGLHNERHEGNDKFSIRFTGWKVDCETGVPIGYGGNLDWDPNVRVMKNDWIKFLIEGDFDDYIIKIIPQIEGLDPAERCFWFNNTQTSDTLEELELKSFRAGMGFDYLTFYEPPPPPVKVWGVSPDSGTEITDLDTSFTFGWEGLDLYDGLLVSFYNKKTRIHANATRFDADVIGFEGENVMNLQEFLFEQNANWYLHAIAFVEVPETYEGLYLTGRYITEYTYNIVSPEYFLTINIEGFSTIFEMEDWETWYDEHAEQFETPTLLFGRVATLFAPTFENIGEFGQRILDYFEVDKAYSRGYELGLAIPIFSFYLTDIEMFFGGLPILKLFLMTLILMVGIFLFKIVMKFIPFFG